MEKKKAENKICPLIRTSVGIGAVAKTEHQLCITTGCMGWYEFPSEDGKKLGYCTVLEKR